MKNDQYFPFEANMFDDDRLCKLIEDMGMEGVGIYVTLLAELRRRDHYRCNMQSLPRIARNMSTSMDKLLMVIVDYNLFQLKGNFEKGTLSSFYLDRVMTPLDDKRKQRKKTSKKTIDALERAPNGRFTVETVTVKKSKEEKSTSSSTEEEEAATVATEKLSPIQPWEVYVDEATSSQSWLELTGKQSGLGMDFFKYLPFIICTFKEHILTQGTEHSILSLRDAKSYFANYIRSATPTNKRVRELLEKEKARSQQENPYRYEDVDPVTGARSYCGISIPPGAPPRPGENSLWDAKTGEWSG